MIGHHVSRFFPEDPALEELLDAARSGRTSAPRDTHWSTRDGTPVDVAISVSHLDSGEDAGYSVLARDIRVRKAAEEQLQRQARVADGGGRNPAQLAVGRVARHILSP